MPQPKPVDLDAFNSLIHELNAFVKADMDELQRLRKLREFETRANELKGMNVAFGLSALGSIAAARRDIASMHKFHKVSIQHNSRFELKRNYAVSMAKAALPLEAMSYAHKLLEIEPNDPTILHLLASIHFNLGDEQQFVHYAETYQKTTGDRHGLWNTYLEELAEMDELSSFCAASVARDLVELEA